VAFVLCAIDKAPDGIVPAGEVVPVHQLSPGAACAVGTVGVIPGDIVVIAVGGSVKAVADNAVPRSTDQTADIVVSIHLTGGIGLADLAATAAAILPTDQSADIGVSIHCTGGIGLADAAAATLITDQSADIGVSIHRTGGIGLADTAATLTADQAADTALPGNITIF